MVVIERDPELVEQLINEGVLVIPGDATDEKTISAAGVERARAVITALPEDADNVFIAITAKDLCPGVRIIARAHRTESAYRLKRAGADAVISPAAIAGNRMALAALKPASVAFIQTLIERRNLSLVLEEIVVSPGSTLAGKPIRESRLREDFNTQVLAIDREGEIIQGPSPDELILAGDTLVVFGPGNRLADLEVKAQRAAPGRAGWRS
ncbi:MAG: TrkA family potassium uptake protein [Bacillota bacterium]|nr:TrkA family potassium uptake protein [Bacillota bacterium]